MDVDHEIFVGPFSSFQRLKKGSRQLLANMGTEYWLTALPGKSVVKITDSPDMTIAVCSGHETHSNIINKALGKKFGLDAIPCKSYNACKFLAMVVQKIAITTVSHPVNYVTK